ncbi:MAG: hypothetical protein ABL953_10590 [Ilumatobacteraceae bacterium]
MDRNNLRIRTAAIIAGLSILSAACSSEKSSSGGTGASTSSSASTATVATTPDTVGTTIAPTTTVPAPLVFTLRGDGIGPFDLGIDNDDLIDALTTAFGAPSSDDFREYPVDDGFGGFQTVDGEFGFVVPFGRTLCWAFELCVELGGAEAATEFLGWSYGEGSGSTLSSTSGLTVGSRGNDYPAMNVHPGGCYSIGYGDIDGITLTLQSDDVQFTSFDDLGNYVEAVPPPEQLTVVFMQAGDIPAFLFGDC